ncbi:hypothetical protein ACLOJK_017651 [Asimina triloba]
MPLHHMGWLEGMLQMQLMFLHFLVLADQVRGLTLREIGGGFTKHHRAPSIRAACYAIAKPSTMVQKMEIIKKLRGHQNAVYCAIFDRSGRYVITGSDDRLVKIWSMETAFCLSSCRGHEGDITDLAVSSNNALVASASNDCTIRVWRLPDGLPISVLRGHTAAVTAIAFSPRPSAVYQLLSSSDDGTCRIWDARYSQSSPRIYIPKPADDVAGKSNDQLPGTSRQSHQILCCAFNANGTVFVTGSSDTYARVWNAVKNNTEDSEQPNHEMDVLSGHENDVNYGKVGRWTRAYHLKVPPPPMPPQPPRGGPRQRFQPTPRGVNMIVWSLDNRFVLAAIMDCRICVWNAIDGSLVHSLTGHSQSALAYTRTLDLIHGPKVDSFYSPHQSAPLIFHAEDDFYDSELPNPMVGCMDTYVLDVHPFNPRIAMSAGYDGKTIIWDIWEGAPVRTYETGRFKLVDGKFSPDGTSIILSDEVGQIYILASGQGESQKDAKYDQFFLGDYRPLTRDTHGNVVDQETQLAPHRRNIQDLLCDSSMSLMLSLGSLKTSVFLGDFLFDLYGLLTPSVSLISGMIPYPEPYQSMYQRRRLGALGIEWRPPSVKFAVGPGEHFGLQDYQMLPIPDLERWIEPLPEFVDAMDWEPENEIQSDGSDSEYNVPEEYSSEGEQASFSSGSFGDPECSAEDIEADHTNKDALRRSKRRNHRVVELTTSSGRRVKRKNLDDNIVTPSKSNRRRKPKHNRPTAKKNKSSKSKSVRPQRLAARNALNLFSQISGASTDEEEEDNSENDSSNSGSELPDLNVLSNESDRSMQNVHPKHHVGKEESLDESETSGRPPEPPACVRNDANRRKLVLKLPVRNPKKLAPAESTKTIPHELNDAGSSSSKAPLEMSSQNPIPLLAQEPGPSSSNAADTVLPQNFGGIKIRESGQSDMEDLSGIPVGCKDNEIRWGEVKARSSKRFRVGDAPLVDSCPPLSICLDSQSLAGEKANGDLKSDYEHAMAPHSENKTDGNRQDRKGFRGEELLRARNSEGLEDVRNKSVISAYPQNSLLLDSTNGSCNGMTKRTLAQDKEYETQIGTSKYQGYNELPESVDRVTDDRSANAVSCKNSAENAQKVEERSKPIARKLKIVSKRISKESQSPSTSKPNTVALVQAEHDQTVGVLEEDSNDEPVQEMVHDSKRLHSYSINVENSVYGRSKSYQLGKNPEMDIYGLEESTSNDDDVMETGYTESLTDGACRRRSTGMKVTTHEQNPSIGKFSIRNGHGILGASRNVERYSLNGHKEQNPGSSAAVGLRSSRNRRENHYDNDLNPRDRRKTHHLSRTTWLMLTEHEESYRYIPQKGDEVVYVRQGHQQYIEWCQSPESGPWRLLKGNMHSVEYCKVVDLDYSTLPGSGESCCKLTLEFADPCSSVFGKIFKLTLPELVDFTDYIVEKTRYDASLRRNWTHRDKCQVWWRYDNGSGKWYNGRIVSVKPKSPEFLDCPWECCVVQYTGDTADPIPHSPWELHDPGSRWEHPHIEEEVRDKLLSSFAKLGKVKNQEHYGIQKLTMVSQKSDFLNRFPVPLSLEVIKRRLENNYYRSLEAVQHDIMVMLSNFQTYFGKNSGSALKMRRLSDYMTRVFSAL